MKPFEHQVYHRNVNPCLPGFRQFFVVFAESPTPAQPGQGALHHPPAGQYLKPVAVPIPAHHAQYPTTGGPSPRYQPPSVGGISPDDLEPGEPVQQLDQHQLGPISVLDVGGMNCYRQEQPGGIHYNVALAPRYLLPRIVAPRPPFSVVFTDWLSMMAALGVASLPSLSRTWLRSASSTRSQVPSARHFRKYHHTVPRAAGHGAPSATVCRCAIRTVCRLLPLAGPQCAGAPGPMQEATRAPNAPIGNPSNRWDTSSDPYPNVTTYPPIPT